MRIMPWAAISETCGESSACSHPKRHFLFGVPGMWVTALKYIRNRDKQRPDIGPLLFLLDKWCTACQEIGEKVNIEYGKIDYP